MLLRAGEPRDEKSTLGARLSDRGLVSLKCLALFWQAKKKGQDATLEFIMALVLLHH